MNVYELLQLSEDELFAQIGNSLPKTRRITDLSVKGRMWLEANKKRIVDLVCPRYEVLKNKSSAEAALEIAAIIGDFFTGVPALIISVIILKTGLSSFCK